MKRCRSSTSRGGTGKPVNNLADVDCEEMNRPVRTRMPGGVGMVPEQSGPLSRSLLSAAFLPASSRFGFVVKQ
jgi:hypothetical protein